MKQIKIDKNIPIPPRMASRTGMSMYPYETMKVGDSFFTSRSISSMSPTTSRYNKILKPKKFAGRSVTGGSRIWRIK